MEDFGIEEKNQALQRYKETLDKATDEQKKIVDTSEGVWAVLAGPGSGKTATMTTRIARLVHDGVPPERILMLTFTVKSANEMRHRAVAMCPACENVLSGTFHSVGLKLLRHENFGNEWRWHVLSAAHAPAEFVYHVQDTFANSAFLGEDRGTLIRAIQKEYGFNDKHVRQYFTTCRDADNPATAHDDACVKFLGRHKTEEDRRKFAESDVKALNFLHKAMESFREYKRKKWLLELDDIVPETCRLLREQPELQNYFHYVCVDEYQDTGSDQYDMSLLLSAGHGNLLCVGDDKQSIYGWRKDGADVENFMRIVENAGDHVLYLSTNFRSNGNIVDMTNFSQNLIERRLPSKPMVSSRTDDVRQSVPGCFMNPAEEAEGIARMMIQAHMQGVAWSDMAVLFRSHKGPNSCSNRLQKAMMNYRIPMRLVGSSQITDLPETQICLSFLQLMKNPTLRSAWAEILQSMPFIGGTGALQYAGQMIKGETYSEAYDILQTLFSQKKMKEEKKTVLDECFHLLSGVCASMDAMTEGYEFVSGHGIRLLLPPISQFLQNPDISAKILDRKKFDSQEDYDERIRLMLDNIEYLGDLAQSVNDLDAFLDTFFTERNERKENLNEGVTLSTIHSAKGLEWKIVFVADLVSGMLPCASALKRFRSEDPQQQALGKKMLDEEARVFYVALSRAKEDVFFSLPRKNDIGEDTVPSPFITFLAEKMHWPQLFQRLDGFDAMNFSKDDEPPLPQEAYVGQYLESIGLCTGQSTEQTSDETPLDSLPF